ncbi:hypothetical protein C943_04600 [Mariniradius saccharolyticus AK6]|uniref:Uncharacterized protein n=1 Tax=Mariniradius saccharolyticus AK6 TaxID=1239962 RepID=M7Y954_9BACT|nr:hypothetical protein C943_04600 [Mariniradius saccharolyticus AK6]
MSIFLHFTRVDFCHQRSPCDPIFGQVCPFDFLPKKESIHLLTMFWFPGPVGSIHPN